MLRYKALNILRTFTPEEVKQFTHFLDSPYFNTSKKVARLFRILKPFHPDFSSQKFTNRNLKKKIGTISDSTLKNLFANLYPLCEKFISLKSFLTDGEAHDIQLISGLFQRNLHSLCKENITRLRTQLDSGSNFHTMNLHTLFQLENYEYNIDMFSKPVKGKEELQEHLDFYTRSHDYLFYYYFSNALNSYIMMLNISKLMEEQPSHTNLGRFFEEFFPIDKIEVLLHNFCNFKDKFIRDVFELQWLYVKIRIGKDIFKDSRKYIKLLKQVSPKLHADERYNYYMIFNLWYPEVLEQDDFIETEFEFYNDMLEKEAYKSTGNEHMSIRNFTYLCMRGDTTGRFEWTDNVVDKHIHAIEPAYRNSVIALRNSYLQLLKYKDLEMAMIELNKVKHHNELKLKREIRYLTILIQMEKREFKLALTNIENFSKFLNGKDIPSIDKHLNTVFLKYCRIVCQHFTGEKPVDLQHVSQKIENEKYFVSKDWLIKFIDSDF